MLSNATKPKSVLSLIACTQWSQLILTFFDGMSSQQVIYPQKSQSKNLRIGFPLSPPPNHTLLPLTHDLTTFCIGWVQASDVQALCVLHFHVYPKSTYYSHVRNGLETCLHNLPPILGFLWHEPFSGLSFFKACSFWGQAFAWSWAFPPSTHSLSLSAVFAYPAVLLCCSCCGVI